MAGDDRGVMIGLPITCSVEERDRHFAAAIRQFGMVVYGPTAGGVGDRVDEAVRFYLDGPEGLENAWVYFDRHRIEQSVHYPPSDADGGCALRRRISVTVANVRRFYSPAPRSACDAANWCAARSPAHSPGPTRRGPASASAVRTPM